MFRNTELTSYRSIICYCAYFIIVRFKNVESLYGDVCSFRGATGTCLEGSKCYILMNAFENKKVTSNDIVNCGMNIYEELVCCPNEDIFSTRPVPSVPDIDTTTTTTTPTTTTTITTVKPNKFDDRLNIEERPSERACKNYYAGTAPSLTVHVLEGTPVELGEYPHMAAIGFSPIGGNRSALTYDCGGTLIHERFVLTAAHCLLKREQTAEMVRLGVTNFLDPVQMASVVEKKILKSHIHPNYIISKKYNDIALLELESPVQFTVNVYPTCLYTQEKSPEEILYVSGWGVINTTSRASSDLLLKVPLVIQPIHKCNATYAIAGLPRSIGRGLLESQLCAYDPGNKTDACQGDSGGPLIMNVDVSQSRYKVVGIVSSGFNCGLKIPGLYTRVYSFLDFIENIVWP